MLACARPNGAAVGPRSDEDAAEAAVRAAVKELLPEEAGPSGVVKGE